MKIKVACNIVENFLITHNADAYTTEAFTALAGYVKGVETRMGSKSAPILPPSRPVAPPQKPYGKAWDKLEENALKAEFYSGIGSQTMAQRHERTIEAIAARLVKLGCIKSRDELLGYSEYRDMMASRSSGRHP